MGRLAVVPARKGSKGLPGKNLAEIGGVSLVARAVTVAREVGLEVVVSSDDAAILDEGRRFGATPDQRPAELAGDLTTAEEVAFELLRRRPDVTELVWLQPTSPFRTTDDVQRCLDELQRGPAVTTVTALAHPAAWIFGRSEQGTLDPILGWDALARRRQEAPEHYELNGAVYCIRTDHLMAGERFVGPHTRMVSLPAERALDIDTQADLDRARALHEQWRASGR